METSEMDEWMDNLHGVEERDILSLAYVSKIKEFTEICEFMEDEDLGEILDLALRCFAEPHLRPETARTLLIKFQAASVKFGTLSVFYTTLKKGKAGTEENYKKNIYYTLADLCDKMAQSLKYVVRRHGVE